MAGTDADRETARDAGIDAKPSLERGLMMVFSNASSMEQVEEFNRWYDETHLKEVLEVPGVVAASRYELDDAQMMPGEDGFGRRFLAVYEIEAEDLETVRDRIRATSSERTHSKTLELDPLPAMAIYRSLGARVED